MRTQACAREWDAHAMQGALSEPFISPSKRKGTTVMTASAALVKAIVGTGIFALPPAIRASGLLLGSAVSLLMGVVSLYTTWAMLEAVRELRRRGHAKDDDGRLEYTAVAGLYAPRAERILTVLCIVGQFGSSLGYFAFICTSVQPFVASTISRPQTFAIIAAIEAPLILLRDTSHPAFEAAMAFGNVAVGLALCTVLWGTVFAPSEAYPHPPITELKIVDPGGVGLLFGVTLIMFSCHLESVSIEADMASRDQFDRVMHLTFWSLFVVYISFGLAVYASLGEATGRVHANPSDASSAWMDATIMQNLDDGAFVIAVKLLMSLNLVMMMPITLLPASRAMEQMLGAGTPATQALARLAMIVSLAVAAALLPGFEMIVGLTGALGGVTCFTLPVLCYAHFCGDVLPMWQLAAAYSVAAFGVVGTLWSFVQQLT